MTITYTISVSTRLDIRNSCLINYQIDDQFISYPENIILNS